MIDLTTKIRADSRTTIAGPVMVQIYSVHVKHFLATMYKNTASLEKCRHVYLSKWFGKWRRTFYGIDAKAIPAFDTSVQRMLGKK